MSVRPCSHYRWTGHAMLPPVPYEPEPGPGWVPPEVPAQPGRQGDRWLCRVFEFPSGVDRGVLWDGAVETLVERLYELGPNQVSVSAPTNTATMRILGDPIPRADGVYHLGDMVSRELHVGSTRSGKTRWRFVLRDEVTVRDHRVTLNGVGIVGGVTRDRIIGAPTRLNLLGSKGRFGPTLSGWRHVGPGESDVQAGGVDGSGWSAWVTGKPGYSYIEARVRWGLEPQPWKARQWFGAQSYVYIPEGEDLDGYGLIGLAVVGVDGHVWWPAGDGDTRRGNVQPDMPAGEWTGPVTCQGLLPRPPYEVDLCVRLYATHETKKTHFDDVRIVRPENTSTGIERDLVQHPKALFKQAQHGREKSTWNVRTQEYAETGTVRLGRWAHEDGQSLDEALAALSGQGVEVWDKAGPGRVVAVSARRGAVRGDIVLNPWDVLGTVTWTVDPGKQKSAARGLSGAASLWGGSDAGKFDTRWTRGQIIDITLSAPIGMFPAELEAWLNGELAPLAILPGTTTVLVRRQWAERVTVGDTVPVRIRDDAAGHVDWMRISQMAHNLRRGGICAVDLGTDTTIGAR